jgi:hypothetical protein
MQGIWMDHDGLHLMQKYNMPRFRFIILSTLSRFLMQHLIWLLSQLKIDIHLHIINYTNDIEFDFHGKIIDIWLNCDLHVHWDERNCVWLSWPVHRVLNSHPCKMFLIVSIIDGWIHPWKEQYKHVNLLANLGCH